MTVRLTRFLARAGASSRRGAADLIAADRVRINGKPPLGPGDPVDPATDVVTLDGRTLTMTAGEWLALHKPTGYITSRAPGERHPTVFTLLKDALPALVAVGRLDVMSEGLLLFTTDGELASRLMHPKYEVPRCYRVMVTGSLDADGRRSLDQGIVIEGEERPARPARWSFTPAKNGGALDLDLTEGRSRIVRRICTQLGLGVRTLTRMAYGPVALDGLAPGLSRHLEPAERDALYRAVQLDPNS
ncbi:MAG TPA: pseudouridine synthase [Gemmatimonadales bacterium]